MILAIVRDAACLAREYLEGLTEADRKKLWALLERASRYGPPLNEQKFTKLEGPLFEFKSYQDRLPCFFDGPSRIVLTHGFKKKKDKAPKVEIERALRLMAEYGDSKPKQERKK